MVIPLGLREIERTRSERVHREYQPADMHHLRSHAFGMGGHAQGPEAGPHQQAYEDGKRSLYTLTAILSLLVVADLGSTWIGFEWIRAPLGVPLIWLAAILGAARIVYGALEALLQGRIGADVALAQACLAAIVIGQPFVAAEVVLIALVGEVLEAVTFARTPA